MAKITKKPSKAKAVVKKAVKKAKPSPVKKQNPKAATVKPIVKIKTVEVIKEVFINKSLKEESFNSEANISSLLQDYRNWLYEVGVIGGDTITLKDLIKQLADKYQVKLVTK